MPRRELHLSVYDPDWYNARLKAYIDVYEGGDVGIARHRSPIWHRSFRTAVRKAHASI